MIPVFINCRDRVTDLRALVDWLEKAGQERIVLLDNASTWEPLVEYLRCSPHEVVQFGENVGSRSLWLRDIVPQEWFVYTDPDVIPVEDCPDDAIEHLRESLEAFAPPHTQKAGLGLYLDDVSEDLPSLGWERTLVENRRMIGPGVFDSLVDTTFAVYRPGASFDLHGLRTALPYQARHTSWYITTPDDENRYYLDHAIAGPTGSSWAESA